VAEIFFELEGVRGHGVVVEVVFRMEKSFAAGSGGGMISIAGNKDSAGVSRCLADYAFGNFPYE
jgi:hypothetical protein